MPETTAAAVESDTAPLLRKFLAQCAHALAVLPGGLRGPRQAKAGMERSAAVQAAVVLVMTTRSGSQEILPRTTVAHTVTEPRTDLERMS